MNTTLKANQQEGDSLLQLQSSTIDVLRFPLAVMVVFIHMTPNVINLFDAEFPLVSGVGMLNLVGIILSHVLSHIAVPSFYFISGLLFFVNFQQWSWSGYKKKMKSRMNTLVIPYVLWNLCTFLLLIGWMLKDVWLKGESMADIYSLIADRSWHIFYDYHEWDTDKINWLGGTLRMTGPYDLPLWFLRDLIVVSVLTPFIYYFVKKLRIVGVVLLFIAYISRIWIIVPGFQITAFFYFTTGAYFALHRINVVAFVRRYKYFILPFSLVLFVITTIYDGTNTVIGQNIYPFFICLGVFSAFYIASTIIEHYHIKPSEFLVSTCFFIYALHAASIPEIETPLFFTQRLLHFLIPGLSGIENGVCYVLSPFFSVALCMVVLVVLRKLCPKLTSLFSGNK